MEIKTYLSVDRVIDMPTVRQIMSY